MLFKNNTTSSIEAYLSIIRDALPSVDALLSRYETMKLHDYVAQLDQCSTTGFQDNQDFIDEMANYTRESLGNRVGEAISEDLHEMPQVLTANHHGIDTFAQSTQSNLLFSMRSRANGKSAGTVPVLACGSIPMNNLTYPRGLLIYAHTVASGAGEVCKLPLFPDRHKRTLVSVAEPFTGEMLGRARIRAKKLANSNKVAATIDSALNTIFDDLGSIDQAFSSYSQQATVVNNRLWRRLFRGRFCDPELVYIEFECIASRLLQKDLFDDSTICHQLMFDRKLRERLIENLDGQRGCWKYEKLMRRCTNLTPAHGMRETDSQGTMFFWGVDAKGRKIPLYIKEGDNGKGTALSGIDDNGNLWASPFTPSGIVRGLREGRLLPSIFTSYLLISIARGVSCIGGYYQADYLPVMRQAVNDALRSNSGEMVNADFIGKIPSDLYLSGMQTIGFKLNDHLLPAGPVEIIASGGLDAEQYERIGEVTVLQSHIASLYDTITDIAPATGCERIQARQDATRLIHDAIGNKIVAI